MARDFENLHDISELDDRELRDLVREQLSEHGALDIDDITVAAHDGRVVLSGRVGTDGERRIAEHVLTDVIGVADFTNEIVVDPIRRAESPMAVDEHLADEAQRAGTLLGDAPAPLSPEADHLVADLDDELSGTTDYQDVMENGVSWNPPDTPTPEGYLGSNVEPEDMGEQH
jgi:hypothetical protein